MEAPRRNAPLPVIAQLCAEPERFGFFQAVRLLEAEQRQARRSAQASAEGPSAEFELVRFHVPPALRFPEGELASLEPRPGGGWEMGVTCLGLIGAVGTLPQHYTELVQARLQLRDRTLLEFLDLFQHRALALFYRAWRKYRFAFEAEARGNDCGDAFSRALMALVGFHVEARQERLSVAAGTLAFLSGHLAHRPRSAIGLERMLSEFFGLSCRVEQFVGQWLGVPEGERSHLSSRALRGNSGALGQGFLLGGRVWDVGSKLRVHFGPLSADEIAMLVPGGAGHERLSELLWSYLGPGFDCDLVVEPAVGGLPGLRLGQRDVRLGRNSWLVSATGRMAPATLSLSRRMSA